MNIDFDAIRSGAPIKSLVARLPKIPTASAVSGLIVAALILMTPNDWFEAFIVETGLPGLVSAAEPPLGARARIVFALGAALLVTSAAWAVLSFILARKRRAEESTENWPTEFDDHSRPATGSLRQADAHPDAPYRRPIMAEDDLGAPFDRTEVAVEEDCSASPENVPLDLGQIGEMISEEEAPDRSGEAVAEPVHGNAAEEEAIEKAGSPEPVFEIPLPRRDEIPDVGPADADTAIEQAVSARPALPVDSRTELARLVDRLEAGIERKKMRERDMTGMGSENVPTGVRTRSSDGRDTALREALNALQEVAARGTGTG